jgi:hypothetical protein
LNSIGIIKFGASSGEANYTFSLSINAGKLGPYISASSKPVLYPSLFIAIARFTAMVDFPTPPLQLATAIIFLMFLSWDVLTFFAYTSS